MKYIGVLLFTLCVSISAFAQQSNEKIKPENDSISAGKQIFENNCGKCHTLFTPSKFNASQWGIWVNRMQKRAHITDEQKILVLKYLASEAKK